MGTRTMAHLSYGISTPVDRHHIFNALSICWETAGASKHYHWQGSVERLSPKPIVNGWYQYFTSSRQPDLHIEYSGEVYGLSQVRGIVLQFYEGLFASLDISTKSDHDV